MDRSKKIILDIRLEIWILNVILNALKNYVTLMKLRLSFEFNFFSQKCILLCTENTEALIE